MSIRSSVALGLTALVTAALLAGPAAGAADVPSSHTVSDVQVRGAVSAPRSYSPAQLAALPQTTAPGHGGGTVTGVALEDLVNDAVPQLPAVKNAPLRVVATVIGSDGQRVAFALGELDPYFGNHPALLVPGGHHDSALVVPGDVNDSRSIADVATIRVSVVRPRVPTPAAGSILVLGGPRPVLLSAARLASLPQRTKTVTFFAGTASQTHVEQGPTLARVLAAAHLRCTAVTQPATGLGPATSVAAVGSDGYTAAVTLAEATVGGRPLLVSLREDGLTLAQPRLVTDGDIKGGRYVSDVESLVVNGLAAC